MLQKYTNEGFDLNGRFLRHPVELKNKSYLKYEIPCSMWYFISQIINYIISALS